MMPPDQNIATGGHAASPPQLPDPWSALLDVSALVTVEVPIESLTVRELFRLERGSILAALQPVASNVPVLLCNRLVAWGEFQVAGERLAVRLAEFT